MSEPKTSGHGADVTKKHRGHGVPVPVISLRKAIELVNKVWEKEKRNAAPVPAVMAHWGYGLKSSGGFQAIASLKRFGLLEEQGSNEKRTLKLTPLALDILKNSTTDLKEHTRLIKEAALAPKAHQELWEKYGVELPSDQTLETYLVFDKNFSGTAAKAFISVYKDTIEFAKLGEQDKSKEMEGQKITPSQNSHLNEETPAGSDLLHPPQPQERTPQTLGAWRSVPAEPVLTMSNPAAKYFTIPTDAGEAAVPMGMSLRDFELFKKALELFKRKIVGQIVFPLGAIWHNKDADKPVLLIAEMGEKHGVKYFQTQDGTGVPESELEFI